MRLALLVVPLLLAGCTSGDGLGFAGRGEAPREPYYKEHREVVSGEHERAFEMPVDAARNAVNVTILLQARTNGLPLPDASLAQLRVTLLDPDGAVVKEVALDARQPRASLLAEDLAPGLHHVLVKGAGAAPELDGRAYGAQYLLTVEVEYPA